MIYAGDTTPADLTTAAPDETRHGDGVPASVKNASRRKKPDPVCIVTGESREPERMLRFVVGPDDTLYPDFTGTLPGQAYWCNLYGPTLREAINRRVFGENVTIPANILEIVENGLRDQALSMISMARKAGHFYAGAEKAEQLIRSGRAAIYLTASEKDADTRQKLTYLANLTEGAVRVIDLFTSDEISRASGMNKLYHAALMRSDLSDRFFAHVRRLNLFRQEQQQSSPEKTTDRKQP